MKYLSAELVDTLRTIARGNGLMVFLSGAGVSAESGIPTFRGEEGYWVVGSKNYAPTEMATRAMFERHPEAVWQWYLYRRTLCNRAEPNAGHQALVHMERLLEDRFLLITQNVDGLHQRAGNSPDRTYPIHGDINTMRCSRECSRDTYPLPGGIGDKDRTSPLEEADREALVCPGCGHPTRPHVLWFDECYDEVHYRFESSLRAGERAALLVTAGTSGATNLPMQIGSLAARRGIPMVDVNPDANPFSRMAENEGGFFCQGTSGDVLPWMAEGMAEVLEEGSGSP